MSFDYYVIVHREVWPTATSVQDYLEKLGYPVSLVATPPGPLSIQGEQFGLPVVFEGRAVTLEADIERLTDADDPESLFGYIALAAAPNFAISNGDYALTLTFRSDADQIRAGLYLAAAMIKSFDGYGFENQMESHGGLEFADQLLAEAIDVAAFEEPLPQYPPAAETGPTRPKSAFGFVRSIFRPN